MEQKSIEMTKESQIEELANDYYEVMLKAAKSFGTMSQGVSKFYARHLYEKGYRKQSEVIDDFVKRLLDAFPEPHRGGNLCPAIYYDDYRYIIEELAEEMKGGAE